MVAFLKKPEGSEGFHQIVDFLNSTHIKYALTKNPTIYVSLIHQFWQTASASTYENGEMEKTATIDGRVKIVTEASIRRLLKLEDFDGISTLPNTEIFEQLALMGPNISEEAATMPHDSPLPRVHSLGSDEGNMTLHEFTLIMKVKKLEKRIKSSKTRRRVRLIVSEDEDDLEDPSKQGRKIAQLDEDEGITLFTAPEEVYNAGPDISTANVPVSTAGVEVSTASPEVKTTTESLLYIKKSASKRKDKGKAIMKKLNLFRRKQSKKEIVAQHRAEQRRNMPIDSSSNKELTFSKISTGSSKRTAETELDHEGSKRQKTNEHNSQRGKGIIRRKSYRNYGYSFQWKKSMLKPYRSNIQSYTRRVYSKIPIESIGKLVRVVNHTEAYQTFDDMLKKFDTELPGKLLLWLKERFSSTDPTNDKERTLWVELKRLFEPDIDDILWKLQRYMHDPLTWRLYDTCGVHHVSTDRGHDIFMLVEKDYPLTRGILTLMLCNKLQVDQYSEMANELLKKIFILANRPRQ
ncbi:hypothetical protein Tco_0702518 [Tanacetum coccineum]|uniref:Xylulose kinase-1 n=1 Tax=Tanacetum coccineum TaxID=301880 RepID=A0ABQ4XX19_9ASTR